MLWYSLEAPHWGASKECPQHMFSWRNDVNPFGLKKENNSKKKKKKKKKNTHTHTHTHTHEKHNNKTTNNNKNNSKKKKKKKTITKTLSGAILLWDILLKQAPKVPRFANLNEIAMIQSFSS